MTEDKASLEIFGAIWVVVRIGVSFWVPIIARHLIFRVPKKGTLILTATHMYGT